MAERWQDEAWAKEHVVERQDDPPHVPRLSARRRPARWAPPCWSRRPGVRRSGRPSRTRSACMQPLTGTAAAGGKTALVGSQHGGRAHQQGRRRQRPAHRGCRGRLRIQARRRPPQGGEARARGQGRRRRGRLSLQRVPGLHAGVRGAQDRLHDRRVPGHDDHHSPSAAATCSGRSTTRRPRRWRPRRTWSTRWARSGTSPTPTTRGASRPRTPSSTEIKKNGGEVVGTHGHPARHRRHDAVPLEDQRQLRRRLRHLLRRHTGIAFVTQSVRPRAQQEVQVRRRRRHRGCPRNLPALGQQGRGLRRHRPLRARAGGRC